MNWRGLQSQLQCNTSLLQWLIGRFGGTSESIELPDAISLPCTTLENVHRLESKLAEKDIYAKVVLYTYFHLNRFCYPNLFVCIIGTLCCWYTVYLRHE